MGFTKLDEGILQSSVMAADPVTFKVWIALLAAAKSEAIGLTASILYRESASDKPSRQALRDRAVRLDQYLLKHRIVSET